ncbi:NifB/NifX family molybdenum-iron cluster-binding protein [Desulfocurvibacter africanus]|uniref:Dinitrogenase iron-molybdenum cofactor biosynthesis protein n=1 Tax=Desulfocurvibacter africanus subsp. africanus str. Walvis Bay TaxID=690850 RepID=F3YZ72_DESAF|nr:hypothetical protein [Desulfocurvibacter africanus]EGJ50828.1 hypothetical protein Desaf_2505 [Desulfocurvibacter africanus subsp. africanus str. Walvis Bay]
MAEPRKSKVLIPLHDDDVAPRFDLATEVWIGVLGEDGAWHDERTLVLPQASAENLCNIILHEAVGTLVCGGIEEEFYQYLRWKRVEVFDSVLGPRVKAATALAKGELKPGDILYELG